MSTIVTASDGTQFDLDNVAQTFTYTGSTVTAITVNYAGKTFVQTFTYTGSNLTATSNWVKQ